MAVPPSAFRWASIAGTAAPGSNEHPIAPQVDHLLGFRDRKLDCIVSSLFGRRIGHDFQKTHLSPVPHK
jgi:hypothetical protein